MMRNGWLKTAFPMRVEPVSSINHYLEDIQAMAGDIIKVAMIRVDNALRELKSRVLLQVHDELVVEVAPGESISRSRIFLTSSASPAQLRRQVRRAPGVALGT